MSLPKRKWKLLLVFQIKKPNMVLTLNLDQIKPISLISLSDTLLPKEVSEYHQDGTMDYLMDIWNNSKTGSHGLNYIPQRQSWYWFLLC